MLQSGEVVKGKQRAPEGAGQLGFAFLCLGELTLFELKWTLLLLDPDRRDT